MAKHCLRCKKLKKQLHMALQQKAAAWHRTQETLEKQRRAESLIVLQKGIILEAIRR